jgi:GNAT superfamily N-acetyltransferase
MDSRDLAQQIAISPLKNHRHCIPELARWHNAEWGALNPGETLESRRARLETHAGNRSLPLTWVALEQGRLLGSASLVPNDMETRPQLRPWLASVFVLPPARGRGIGSLLVQHIESQARAAGFPRIFLFTPDRESFYQRLGWRLREIVEYQKTTVRLMELEL